MKYIGVLLEIWSMLRIRKRFWLLPIVVFLFGFGLLIALTSGSPFAPLIYTLF